MKDTLVLLLSLMMLLLSSCRLELPHFYKGPVYSTLNCLFRTSASLHHTFTCPGLTPHEINIYEVWFHICCFLWFIP